MTPLCNAGRSCGSCPSGSPLSNFFFTNDSLLYWGQDKMSLQLTSRCVELTSTCLRVSSDYQIEFKFKLQSIVSKWMFKNFLILTFEWRTKKKRYEESRKVYRVKTTDSSLRIEIVFIEIIITRKKNCSTSLTHVDLVISSFSRKFYIITFKELPNC